MSPDDRACDQVSPVGLHHDRRETMSTTTPTAITTSTAITTAPVTTPSAATAHDDESGTYAVARDRSAVLDALIDEHAAEDPARFRMLTGDRPTGPLHIGHYL